MKKYLYIITLIPFHLIGQNSYVLTVFKTGLCNNELIYDDYLDSICKSHNALHKYYIIGLNDNELETYSFQLFGRKYNRESLISKNDFLKLGIDDKKYFYFYIIQNSRIITEKPLSNFNQEDILLRDFNENSSEVDMQINTIPQKDSFTILHKYKFKINDKIRFNEQSIIQKHKSNIFILEPLFNKEIYKLNKDGTCQSNFSFKKLSISDSIYKYYYFDTTVFIYDSIVSKHKNYYIFDKINFNNFFIENDRIFLVGTIELLTFETKSASFLSLNHKFVLELDSNLKYFSFNFDKYLKYKNYYPIFNKNISNFKKDKLSTYLIKEFNEKIDKKIIFYFKISNSHFIEPIGIDTLRFPTTFNGYFNSNPDIDYMCKILDKDSGIWCLDPYPFFYNLKYKNYFNIINDTTITSVINAETDGYYLKEIIKISNENVAFLYEYENVTYFKIINFEDKKVIKNQKIGNITRFNIAASIDALGNLIYFPINSDINNNYIYLE